VVGAEDKDLAVRSFHAIEEAVRPAPQPWADIDRHQHHRIPAGARHDADPAIADVADQAALDACARHCPDLGREPADDLDRLVAAIDHDLPAARGDLKSQAA